MCGRFTQYFTWRELHALLGLFGPAPNLRPRYNVAPTQQVAAVRLVEGKRQLSLLRWGLIPSWAKDPGIGARHINARVETVRTRPAFRAAWKARRRALVPADGFYEWTGPRTARQPWLVTMRNSAPFAFAALWERWTVREDAVLRGSLAERVPGDVLETFTVLTGEPNAAVTPIHDRMPVIVPPERFEPWLAGEDVALDPCPPESMTVHPVSTHVNKPANDDLRPGVPR